MKHKRKNISVLVCVSKCFRVCMWFRSLNSQHYDPVMCDFTAISTPGKLFPQATPAPSVFRCSLVVHVLVWIFLTNWYIFSICNIVNVDIFQDHEQTTPINHFTCTSVYYMDTGNKHFLLIEVGIFCKCNQIEFRVSRGAAVVRRLCISGL